MGIHKLTGKGEGYSVVDEENGEVGNSRVKEGCVKEGSPEVCRFV